MTRTLAALLTLALLALFWQTNALHRTQRGFALYKTAATEQRLAEVNAARADERRTTAAQLEAQNADHLARLTAQADKLRADVAAVSLRERASRLAAAARCAPSAPAAPPGSPPADAPGDLLADMLGRVDDAAGEIGRYADQARLAGQLCQRSYDALSK